MSSISLDQLNDSQKKAVLLDRQNSLILAGAGSGKTRVLTRRIAKLCQTQGCSPLDILAVTFTNKAAKEMRGRIENLLGYSTRGMWIGTFHGIAHRLLRQHASEIGLDRHFKVLDQDDQLQMVKKVIQNLNLDEQYYPPKYLQSFINGKKDDGLRTVDLDPKSLDPQAFKIYQAYEMRLKADSALDFADLLLNACTLLRQSEVLQQYYQTRFKHILVDEFQDTNGIQYQWLKCLKSETNTMMAVGDDDQLIYGWRGAKIENIERYLNDFDQVQIIRLEQNYRSTQTILDAANAVISNNSRRLGKTLWSAQERGEKIALYEAFNERDEADFIVGRIQNLHQNQKIAFNDMAVLYRSNAQSRVIEEALLKENIPYRIYGGLRFFDRAEIKDALAYLRLIALKSDNLAFERIINVPTRGIGGKTLEAIRDYALEHDLSLWQASVEMVKGQFLPARALNALKSFIHLLDDISRLKETLALDMLVRHVIDHTGLLAMYRVGKSEKAEQKLDNLKELVNAAGEFEPPVEAVEGNEARLLEFLSFAVLESGEMQAEADSDCVQMMTLHSAKGLEFSHVFITGLEEGLFPSSRSIDVEAKLAEERRLCYVGITRAMKQLTLSYAKVRHSYGNINYQLKSRFLAEIPTEYVEKIRAQTMNSAKLKPRFGTVPFRFSRATPFNIGEFVSHPKFGIGVFLKSEGEGDETCYHIDFKAGGGKKVLLAKMATLSKL